MSALKKEKTSQTAQFFHRLMRNPSAVMGMVILLTMCLIAVFADQIAQYDFAELHNEAIKSGPCQAFIFGTDDLGRDIFSRIVYGARYSLAIAVLSTLLSLAVSVVLGLISGYYGGWVDTLIMRILDVYSSIPSILIVVIISAAMGAGLWNTIIALAISSIGGMTRLLRAQVMSVKGQEFIEAAMMTNCSDTEIMFCHILPNAITPLIINASGTIAGSLLFAATLSFIGLGIQPPTPEWGAMLAGARSYIRTYPHMLIFPGIFICITVIGFNMLGDAIRDAMDPKLKD